MSQQPVGSRHSLGALALLLGLLAAPQTACSTGASSPAAETRALPRLLDRLDPTDPTEAELDEIRESLRAEDRRGIWLRVARSIDATAGAAIPAIGFRLADEDPDDPAVRFDPGAVVVIATGAGRVAVSPLYERKDPTPRSRDSGKKAQRKSASTLRQFDFDVASHARGVHEDADAVVTTILYLGERSNREVTMRAGGAGRPPSDAFRGARSLELTAATTSASAPHCEIPSDLLSTEGDNVMIFLGSREPGPWVVPLSGTEGRVDPCAQKGMPQLVQAYHLWLVSGSQLRGPAPLELTR